MSLGGASVAGTGVTGSGATGSASCCVETVSSGIRPHLFGRSGCGLLELFEGAARGLLLRFFFSAAFGTGHAFAADPHFDEECFLVIRAGLASEAVLGGMAAASLEEFLKSTFAIGIGDAVAIFEGLEEDSSFQESANGIEAAIEVDRGHDRFEGIGEEGGLIAATGFFFTTAEAEMFAESQAACGDFEGVGVDDTGAAFGKLAFAPLGEIG